MWKIEYSESGGYDSMTGAFFVGESELDHRICLDLHDFGQKNCIEPPLEVVESARALAQRIADALNA